MSYTMRPPPESKDLTVIFEWLLQELATVSSITQIAEERQVLVFHRAPTKPRDGMLVLADGTDWNPGNGRGYYGYDSLTAQWRFLG